MIPSLKRCHGVLAMVPVGCSSDFLDAVHRGISTLFEAEQKSASCILDGNLRRFGADSIYKDEKNFAFIVNNTILAIKMHAEEALTLAHRWYRSH